VSERVESELGLTLVILVLEHVATVSPPGLGGGELWDFVVEETGTVTTAPLLETEPLENVWLLSHTRELGWSPLSLHVVHGVFPSCTGVNIVFPAVELLGGSPVWDLEALEDCAWLSVETDITDTFEKGLWMEVLSKDVVHNIWLLVESIVIDVLNADA